MSTCGFYILLVTRVTLEKLIMACSHLIMLVEFELKIFDFVIS